MKNKLIKEICSVLKSWNPLDVDKIIVDDEYSGYIPLILKVMPDKQKSKCVLEQILTEQMEVGYDINNKIYSSDLDIICDKLIQVYILYK